MHELIILSFICHSLLPLQKNLLGLGVVIGGWSLTGYLVTWFLNQGWGFMLENWIFICIYITLAGKAELERKRVRERERQREREREKERERERERDKEKERERERERERESGKE